MRMINVKVKICLLFVFLGLIGLTVYGYICLAYFDGYKKIDLRRHWPEGTWLDVRFVEVSAVQQDNNELVRFKIPSEKLQEFECRLKQEIKWSEKRFNPLPSWEWLRIVTSEGEYTTRIRVSDNAVEGETWRSKQLKEVLVEIGCPK